MDGEFLNKPSKKQQTVSEFVLSQFPYFISIGMTPEEYWDGDVWLVKYYRKAAELKKKRMNEKLWLQGLYIYDALSRIAPVLRAFPKKGAKAEPYPEEPYPLTQKEVDEAKERKEKARRDKGLRYMRSLMTSDKQEKKEGELNANND